MEADFQFIRPETLQDGMEYWLAERNGSSNRRVYTPVTLVTYDPSPAFVIIKNCAGRKIRCPREDIFMDPEGLKKG
jgi:hypothetical protein